MSKGPIACDKHLHNPVKGYSPCAGCEVERLAIERDEARSELAALKAQMAEPVAWIAERYITTASDGKELYGRPTIYMTHPYTTDRNVVPLYAAPPAAQDVPGLLEALELGLQALNVAVSVYDVQLADRARKGLRQQIAAHRQAQQQEGNSNDA